MARLIIGCGYLGRRVAALWRAQGHAVRAMTRGRDDELARPGHRAGRGGRPRIAPRAGAGPADSVLYAVAPDRRQRDSTAEEVWVEGLANLTRAMRDWPTRPRLLFVSSTGVYGQADGEEVTEAAPTCPADESGRLLERAERSLLGEWWPDAVVLRFAGLYGPGRLLRRQSLLDGEPITADPDGWLNLIHVDDGAAAVVAADERGAVGGDLQCRRRPAGAAAGLLRAAGGAAGRLPPRFVPPAVPDRVNRRVGNRRMLAELGVVLRYPSYEQGLQASV